MLGNNALRSERKRCARRLSVLQVVRYAADLFYPLNYRIGLKTYRRNMGNSAQTITISFWVTGDNVFAPDNARAAGKTYTISAANTWEYKTLTFNGDTTDAPNDDTGIGMELLVALGLTLRQATWRLTFGGQSWLVHSTWQCTGLQLSLATRPRRLSIGRLRKKE